MHTGRRDRRKIGILEHTGPSLGGGQLVAAHMAATLSQRYHVDLIHGGKGYSCESLGTAFSLDLSEVNERIIPDCEGSFNVPGPTPFVRQRNWYQRKLSQPYDVFIYAGHGVPPFSYAKIGLVYCHFPIECCPGEGLKSNRRWTARNPADRWLRGSAYYLLWRVRMARYTTILANSHFTAGWIERRWATMAEVLYPPVDIDVPVVKKRNLIVSLGRFTGKRRTKHQFEQVKAFRQFLSHVRGDWSLCVIGSCGESQEDRGYLEAVQQAAHGLPVTFLVNVERSIISRALGEATLFWHTAGLGSNEQERPQEAEHFGIATIEAMRAGCVPIVINSGGQSEIIENGVNGFLAKNADELTQASIDLVSQNGLVSRMSGSAQGRSYNFTREAFEDGLSNIVERCLTQ